MSIDENQGPCGPSYPEHEAGHIAAAHKPIFAFHAVQDSGERSEFDTGAVRDRQAGKGRYDLLSPIAMRRMARHFENGSAVHGDRNWERGQPLSRFIDSALRHLFQYLAGERDEDHLAAAAWNVMGIMEMQERIREGILPSELDDIPLSLSEEG